VGIFYPKVKKDISSFTCLKVEYPPWKGKPMIAYAIIVTFILGAVIGAVAWSAIFVWWVESYEKKALAKKQFDKDVLKAVKIANPSP
jgi:uncharacterized membrane protein